jgi:hypothetical protein
MTRMFVLALAFWGCASAGLEGRDPALDPGNPRAQEASVRMPTALPKRDPALEVRSVTPAPPSTGEEHEPAGHPPDHGSGRVAPEDAKGAHAHTRTHVTNPKPVVYTCPMHPDVRSSKPGKCPKCGMTLVPKAPDGSTP